MLQYTADAQQQAFNFLVKQATYIEPAVWQVKYPDITYPEFVPVDTSAPEWVKTITFRSVDMTGAARWINGSGSDIPLVGLTREQFESAVHMAGIGYDYTLEELEQARLSNINLTADKGMAARRAYEELCENVAYTGDTAKNFKGLFNQSAVTASNVPNGVSGTATWATKTADEILKDVNDGLVGIFTGTKTTAMADTILIPVEQYSLIGTKRIDAVNQTTVLQWIKQNNIYTMQTGRELTVRANRFLDQAGASSADRMVIYRRSPEVVKMHIPMRLRFLPVQGPLVFRYVVPGMFRLGGVDVRLPGEIRYYDGI